jgi:predicted nucleic acid-binding protein
MTLLIDSVILIDHFNAVHAATAYIRMVHTTAAISVITRAEVSTGFDAAGLEKALPLLDIFQTFDITKEVADRAAKLRREYRWKLPDALQAAVAQTHNLKLVTRNTRDFDPAKHSFVVLPYTLT